MRIGCRRPTRYVFVPGPVIMPGFNPSTRPTRSLGVSVFGKFGSIQGMGPSSDSKIPVLDVFVRGQLGRRTSPHDAALFEDVVGVGDAGQRADVLVDDQDGLAGGLHPLEATPDLRADQRGEAFRGFVE